MTDQPASLAEALALLQTRLPDIKKASKAQYGAYADLADVSRELLPVMGELGLSFSTKATWVTRDDGSREFVMVYTLRHSSGESDSGEYPLVGPSGIGNHQAIGSAYTYGRRYNLCGMTGAVADDDDDGQAASAQSPPAKRQRTAQPPRPVDQLPRNADGQISRKHTTDEEKAAAGIMTDEQQTAHNALEREVKGTDSKGRTRNPQGQHVTSTLPDDPWYDTPGHNHPTGPGDPTPLYGECPACVAGAPRTVRPPRPAGNVAGVIHAEFARLGFTDEQRPARLKVMSTITRRDITSTNDLTAAEALEVKNPLIQACRDQSVLAQKLLERQQETPDA